MPAAAIDQFEELPRIAGPKLRRFKEGRFEKIEYLQLLSTRGHGYVFKVQIDGELYALKIFKFCNLEEIRGMLGPGGRRISLQDIEGQSDPFYAECRAYGRIASRPRKYPIAIACHGFIGIPALQESSFAQKFDITDWNRPEEELSLPPTKQQPLRALVKDLVEVDPEITEELVMSMRRELKALNSLKVYVMDVRWDNYKGGHLADFNSSWTEPHYEYRKDFNSEKDMMMTRGIDLVAFGEMVREEFGMDLSVTGEPNQDFIARLRSQQKKRED